MGPKIVIFLPYFGKFPPYFPLWLASVKANSTIDWLLFTDNKEAYDYPPNVKVCRTTFGDIKERFQSLFDFKIKLDTPWGLCAFRASYGEAFAEYLQGYDFWGYCDCDLIFGDIRRFITDQVLSEFDKILWLGHLSLIRNTPETNHVYRLQDRAGQTLYKAVMQEGIGSCFDEVGLNDIFTHHGFKIYQKVNFADFIHRSYLFDFIIEPEEFKETKSRVFSWDKGRLFCHELVDETIYSTEYLYIHFCRRPMSVDGSMENMLHAQKFAIVPGKIVELARVDQRFIRENTRSKVYWSYILPRLKPSWQLFRRMKFIFLELFGKSPIKNPQPKYWLTNGRR